MKDTGNTEAPSHLLIVQKNTNKEISEEEAINIILLKKKMSLENIHQSISSNHPELIIGDEIKPGKDQYGKAHQTVWQHGDINAIEQKVRAYSFS